MITHKERERERERERDAAISLFLNEKMSTSLEAILENAHYTKRMYAL